MMTDPTRLLDDPSIAASLRADLAQAKAVGLVGFDAAAGAASLEAAIGSETAVATGSAASAGVTKGLALGLVGLVSAGAVALATLGSPEPEPLANVVVPAVVERELRDDVVEPPPELERPAEPDPVAVPEVVVEPESPSVEVSAPKIERPKARAERSSDDYVQEAKLIADARRVLKRDPSRALKILEQAKTDFPRGLLAEEREALTVLSLHEAGRTREARSRGRTFLAAHATSPYADAIRQVLH